jgi:hypothetical protein
VEENAQLATSFWDTAHGVISARSMSQVLIKRMLPKWTSRKLIQSLNDAERNFTLGGE